MLADSGDFRISARILMLLGVSVALFASESSPCQATEAIRSAHHQIQMAILHPTKKDSVVKTTYGNAFCKTGSLVLLCDEGDEVSVFNLYSANRDDVQFCLGK